MGHGRQAAGSKRASPRCAACCRLILDDHIHTCFKEGRQEGRKEGRKEGSKEGRTKGRKEGRKKGRQEGRKESVIVFILDAAHGAILGTGLE